MAFSFAMAQKTDPLLTDIRNQFGEKYLTDLGVNNEFNPTRLQITKKQSKHYADISKSITAMLDKTPVAPFIGSNAWVIGGQKTKSGKRRKRSEHKPAVMNTVFFSSLLPHY